MSMFDWRSMLESELEEAKCDKCIYYSSDVYYCNGLWIVISFSNLLLFLNEMIFSYVVLISDVKTELSAIIDLSPPAIIFSDGWMS